MADRQALVNPSITINGEAIAIVPNSVTLVTGRGKKTMRVMANGTFTETIFSQNLESAISDLSFKLYPADDTIATMETVTDALNSLTVQIADENGFNKTISNGAIMNDPSYELQSDGTITYQIQGDQAV